eukprot:173836-Prorocentrum_minimum.AAC.1
MGEGIWTRGCRRPPWGCTAASPPRDTRCAPEGGEGGVTRGLIRSHSVTLGHVHSPYKGEHEYGDAAEWIFR